MILELITYATALSLLVGLAALMIERALAACWWPRRGLWVLSMIFSLAAPFTMMLGVRLPPPLKASVLMAQNSPPQSPFLQRLPPEIMAGGPALAVAPKIAAVSRSLQAPLKWAWCAGSLALLSIYSLGAVRLRRLKRGWGRATIGAYQVWLTPNVGPAAVGFFRPVIVLPRWLLEGPSGSCDVALAHEQEHISAHDPALLLVALLLLVLTPWNPALWWQVRRLKLAIEVDCDQRVLSRGLDRRQYAHALLQINQQIERTPMVAVAMVGRVSQIERRIRTMLAERPRHLRLWFTGWLAAAIPLLVVAAEINPPSTVSASVEASARHATLGIVVADFDVNGSGRAVAARQNGALVTAVRRGSAADRAGIKQGDVILRYGPTQIAGMSALVNEIAHTAPDGTALLVIRRGPGSGGPFEVTVHYSPQDRSPAHSAPQVMDASDWDTLRDKSLPIKDRKLAAELIQMSGLDQILAQQSALSSAPAPPPNTGIVQLNPPTFKPGTQENVRRLRAIVAEHGWPTVSLVGVRGARAAALIVTLSHDSAFQAEVLARMEPLMGRDEVPNVEYSWLYDVVHTPQRFGTQADCKDGVLTPNKPIEDPAHLDERRAALGLRKPPQFCINAVPAKASS